MAPSTFPVRPAGWYHAGVVGRTPRGLSMGSSRLVAFRTGDGRPAVLDARCAHMAADLSRGTVDGDALRCPLHGWAYGPDGRCTDVPAGGPMPPFARQRAYPTSTLGDHVFFYAGGPTPAYPLPFFDGVTPADLRPARPFAFDLPDVPWYLVTANGFDLQHFAVAHDRRLVGPPVVTDVAPFARQITATFDVVGRSWPDRLTRRWSGPQVTMSVTVYAGTLVLVTATFRRTTTYGLVSVTPTGPTASVATVIVWVPRRRGPAAALDRLDARVRRSFVRSFLVDDAVRSAGVRYQPSRLIDADRELAAYLRWLAGVHRPAETSTTGDPAPCEHDATSAPSSYSA